MQALIGSSHSHHGIGGQCSVGVRAHTEGDADLHTAGTQPQECGTPPPIRALARITAFVRTVGADNVTRMVESKHQCRDGSNQRVFGENARADDSAG